MKQKQNGIVSCPSADADNGQFQTQKSEAHDLEGET